MAISSQVSAIPVSPENVKPEITRRSANFHPSIWGDRFLTCPSDFTSTNAHVDQQFQGLKEEVRKMLVAAADEPSKQLNLIDAIQRLGVFYHFENEIDAALQLIYDTYHAHTNQDNDDLHTVALWFRLLRQQGHHVSCDAFNKFKDSEGKFKESLINNVQGMLNLYEATHLRKHGEDILDEALVFTTAHLESLVSHNPHLSNALAREVMYSLKQPIRKGLPRLKARHYISVYQEDDSHNGTLLKFAKLDFNVLQKVHQKELSDIARWWKDLDFVTKLPFARDRVVECYFWILGIYFEPQYFLARRIITKVIAMTSIIDDIHDVYGTPEELVLFIDAIERWDINAMDQLPEYMRVCYQALIDVYNEIENILAKEGNSYRLHYAKIAMKRQVRAYFAEAKWFHEEYIPTMEEYMCVALVSSGYPLLATTSFVGMGELATKEAFDWISGEPKILRAASTMARLLNDIVSHKFEQKRGHAASAVECYMKQYGGSEEEIAAELGKQVCDAWKDINEECLSPTAVPMPLLTRVLNLARVSDVVYKDGDGYTDGRLKDFVTSLFIDAVPT
ncbi:hypothetical protein F0562_008862 [Nyssa sinensis]|uniref:Uncharacterized protein n=1 Tax=Nyssa sinensis TaxID=561372 RepID=A0A5J5A9D9_9ASTE|nr:hypothetical protein F0562_008862 [Nyssa sinensis]